MAAELHNSISSVITTASEKIVETNKELQQEFKLWELTGTRSPSLQKMHDALQTIQPTSTASERVFSVAGGFATKIRNRMKFKLLNALVFLKYYFLNHK
jgi:hAT family C-terminal dimerisation region